MTKVHLFSRRVLKSRVFVRARLCDGPDAVFYVKTDGSGTHVRLMIRQLARQVGATNFACLVVTPCMQDKI
ncbi:unnamed protein product [Leptosia nina]|uniref:Uncharacterized protein n=1 Tax=Leptosia nina TaxID=320188 RepID=A0AAV1JQG4_9NEOP